MSKRNPSQAFYTIDSWSAICEYMRHRPQHLHAIYCHPSVYSWAQEEITKIGFDVSKLVAEPHSELAAKVWAKVRLEVVEENGFLRSAGGRQHDLIVALDHITDPRNLGAIARSAAFFGVKSIVIPVDRQVSVTDAVMATAQGAFAFLDLIQVVNLGRCLESLKELGYWVLGTAMEGEPLRSVAGFYEKVVVVFGSEDKGMGQQVRKKCDRVLTIPTPTTGIDSLNVSVAAGICLYELTNPRQ